MMQKIRNMVLPVLMLLLLASCISRKKFNSLQASAEASRLDYQVRIDSLQKVQEDLLTQIDSLEAALLSATPKEKTKERTYTSSRRSSKLSAEEEYNSKAMYMYNFCKYVQWPSSFQYDYFVICVAGDSPLIDKLTAFTKGKSINNRKIVVRKYDPKDKSLFHILFIPENQSWNFAGLRTALQNNPTLLVAENASLNNQGSHIGFTVVGNKVKYTINKPAAEKTGLLISQDLVKFAVD